MKQYPFLSGKTRTFVLSSFLFVLLLLARDTIYVDSILGIHQSYIALIGILSVFTLAFLFLNRHSLKELVLDRRMGMFLVSAVAILLPMVVKQDWQPMYFSVLLCLFVGIFFTYFTTMEEIGRYYVLIMTALGVYSVLALYLLDPIFKDVAPVYTNAAGHVFRTYGFSNIVTDAATYRNWGIFREPGVYQFFLMLALYLHNYQISWDRKRQYWGINAVLAITMVSTFASGGLIELGLLILVLFFEKKLYKNKRVIFFIAFVALPLMLVFFMWKKDLLYYIYYAVILKFTSGSGSLTARTESVVVGAQFFFANPLVGEKLATVLHAVLHNTSSTMILLAGMGVLGGVIHVISWVALIWDKNRALWVQACLCVILFMSFNTQNLIADLFFWMFPMMALTEQVMSRLDTSKKPG